MNAVSAKWVAVVLGTMLLVGAAGCGTEDDGAATVQIKNDFNNPEMDFQPPWTICESSYLDVEFGKVAIGETSAEQEVIPGLDNVLMVAAWDDPTCAPENCLPLASRNEEEVVDGDTRVVLRLHPRIAPVTVGVFPLVKKDGLAEKARAIFEELKQDFRAFYDQGGAIGRRYRRQDEIGTPFGVTVDYQTMDDDTVTLRHRDSMEQSRIKIGALRDTMKEATASYERRS